jgi:hypothetical protein
VTKPPELAPTLDGSEFDRLIDANFDLNTSRDRSCGNWSLALLTPGPENSVTRLLDDFGYSALALD